MAQEKHTGDLIARKKQDAPILNFLAFVSGMVTTLVIVLAIWSRFTAPVKIERILAESAKQDSVELRKLGTTGVNPREFEQILEQGSADQLAQLLTRLDNWNRAAALSVRVSENQKRVRVATKMLQLPLTAHQRDLAINSQLSGLSAIYGLDLQHGLKIPNVGADLLAVSKTHRSDPNPEIAQVARLAEAKVEVFEFIKSMDGGRDPEIVEKQLLSLLHDYPDDEFVLSNVRLILLAVVGIDYDVAIGLMRRVAANSEKFDSEKTRAMLRSLHDRATLLESNYQQLFNNRWVNGKSGQRELLKTSLALLRDRKNGIDVIQSVDRVAVWFEQDRQYDVVEEIYQTMVECSDDRADPAAVVMAKSRGQNGIRRFNLVGQPIKFNCQKIQGGSVDPGELSHQVVVMFFWSIDVPQSIQSLNQMQPILKEMSGKGAVLLAVCVDSEIGDLHVVYAQKLNAFQFVCCPSGAATDESLVQQCAVSELPHAMLVDGQGVVQNVNVPINELDSALLRLLALEADRRQ